MSRRLERAKPMWTRSAISIQARSCEDGCIMRPDTRQHLNLRSYPSKTSCFPRGVHTRTFCFPPAAADLGLTASFAPGKSFHRRQPLP
jgi:hypothetical protein